MEMGAGNKSVVESHISPQKTLEIWGTLGTRVTKMVRDSLFSTLRAAGSAGPTPYATMI